MADENATVAAQAADYALRMVGRPYRYGGDTPRGFDCSGLVYYSYHRAGLAVPRVAWRQYQDSRPVSLRSLQKGDLLFFDEGGRKSSHVGIYIGHHRFIHAPATGQAVHISSLNNIYWLHHLESARRFYGD